jgi:hypothetical protein
VTAGAAVTVNVAVHVLGPSQELVTVNVTVAVPPQAGGAPELLFEMAALQPPLKVAVANHAANFASIAACVWQAASVTLAGHVNTTAGAAVTVNVAEQVTGPSQELVTVNVTVAEPPQAGGAPALLLEIAALQPPEKVAVASHAANLELIVACVWQAASVTLAGQVKVTAGAAVTVNVAEHVLGPSQELVTVNVTVVEPPQAGGAPALLFEMAALQPPLKVAVASHAANFVLIADCVWQAASVTLAGQVSVTAGAAVTVNVAEQVTGPSHVLVTVNVTVVVPPQAGGAPELLLERAALQPPANEAVANHAVNFVSIAAWVWHAASVTFTGQVITTIELSTVNVAVQVLGPSHELVTVNVTVVVPPQAFGAPELLLEMAALQPPLKVAVANHVANLASIAAWVWQAASVTFTGHVNVTAGAAVTVNVAWQVIGPSQELVTVNVTVAEPPQAGGAVPALFDIAALQPPVKVAVASQAANLESIVAWVWQAASVTLLAQVKFTNGAAVTVNVAVHTFGASQELVTVNVTVLLPPQAGGAPLLLFDITALQPPENVAVASQAANLESIVACVWQAASVTLAGQVSVTAGAAVTVNVAVQVLGASQELVTVNVTVAVPPQAFGGPELLLDMVVLQPPLNVAVPSQVLNLASIAACVWQAASVTFAGHVSTTAGAAVTVKVAEHVFGPSHELVTVNVTVAVPPQAGGAPELLLVNEALQPPLNVAVASHAANFVLIADCVWHDASVTLAGQVSVTAGAAVTVKVAEHVFGPSHVLVTVNVTVVVPPQAGGAPELLLEMAALHPPLKVAVANHAANLVLIADWVWQAASVTFAGQVKVTAGAVVTVNVAEHVTGPSHELVTVNVTVVEPPQAGGAPELLLDIAALQPPANEAVANHAANLVLMADCVWQAASVALTGHVMTTIELSTVNVAAHVLGPSQVLVTVNVTVVVPPHAFGAPELLFDMEALQPPLNVADANHAANLVLIADWVWQAASVTFAGQVRTTDGAGSTVKVAVHTLGASQELVTVKSTMATPPHAGGADPALLDIAALHPPENEAVVSQVANFASMAAWVWQAASVTLVGQVMVTAGAAVTVNVAVHVLGPSQELVTVNVTVAEPPHAGGAAPALLDIAALQPPPKVAVASQAVNFELIVAWVWQAASVTLVGQVSVTAGAAVTVNVAVQVLGPSHVLVTVNVTVAVPPHAFGAPELLLEMAALQPPLKVAVASQVVNFALMAAWVWQEASVTLLGQVRVTAGAVVTVNVAVHVLGPSQELVTVNVTVVEPPQALGAPLLLFEIAALQPPLKAAVASHAANLESMEAWVWQSVSVTLEGQVRTTAGAVVTVNVAEHVLGPSHELVTVNVTVVEPPQAGGAPELLFDIAALQPPEKVALASQVANLESIEAWVWQAASVALAGQVSTTAGAVVTVNVALQVFGPSQLLVTVNVTVATPPHAGGAPELLLEMAALQPPLNVAVDNHAANFVLIADWVWQAASVTFAGQVSVTVGAAVTVNVAVHVFGASQELVTVNVTVATPPQAGGAPELLFEIAALQPPEKLTVVNHAANFVSIADCVWQAASVTLDGQVSTTAGAAVTVNVAVQVFGASQVLVTVKVTVATPPQAGGAEPALLEMAALQPPEKVAVPNHVANFASIAACVWQAASVTLDGQVSVTEGAVVTVKVAEHVLGPSHELVTVNVTVVDPPQAGGAPALLLEIAALQPPLKVAVANQAENLELILACVWHEASVTLAGHTSVTVVAAVTVNVAEQVTGPPQSLVTVKVTVFEPPHAEGGPLLLLVISALHPPSNMAVANHAAYLLSIVAWVWQAASVTFEGHVKFGPGIGSTSITWIHVLIFPQESVAVQILFIE